MTGFLVGLLVGLFTGGTLGSLTIAALVAGSLEDDAWERDEDSGFPEDRRFAGGPV